MTEPKVRVDAVMGEIERDVRDAAAAAPAQEGRRRRLSRTRRSSTRSTRCSPARSTRATSTPRCCPSCSTATSTGGCRPISAHDASSRGSDASSCSRRSKLLLPLTRWLFEYSQDNFRRQDHLNRMLFACIEELAIENARLRRGSSRLRRASHAATAVSPPMKLACVVHRFGADIAGGSEGHCRLVAEHLAAHHDVTIITTCAQGSHHLEEPLSSR